MLISATPGRGHDRQDRPRRPKRRSSKAASAIGGGALAGGPPGEGDLDGDGKLDLVTSSTSLVRSFLGHGDGTFDTGSIEIWLARPLRQARKTPNQACETLSLAEYRKR